MCTLILGNLIYFCCKIFILKNLVLIFHLFRSCCMSSNNNMLYISSCEVCYFFIKFVPKYFSIRISILNGIFFLQFPFLAGYFQNGETYFILQPATLSKLLNISNCSPLASLGFLMIQQFHQQKLGRLTFSIVYAKYLF